VDEAGGPVQALAHLRRAPVDVVLSDVRMDADDDGIELLRSIKAQWPSVAVILYTGWADPADAVRAMKLGAEDYLQMPVSADVMMNALRSATEKRHPVLKMSSRADPSAAVDIVAASPAMKAVLQWVTRIAPTDASVLIVGETGTGKELIARAIHAGSARRGGPFVPVNCGAIPAGFLEAELFGYKKGAFTSAAADKPGLVEEAHRGTLFLDEISELPTAMQAGLLRFLDRGELRRLGETRLRHVGVRVVAATNRPLQEEIDHGRFRSDLYFRLGVAICEILPLRDRPEDVDALVNRWCSLDRKTGKVRAVTPEAIARLRQHPWPGNVRELWNVLERAALLSSGDLIGPSDVDAALVDVPFHTQVATDIDGNTDERTRLRFALEKHGWNMAQTATSLGISRVTLWRHVTRLNLRHRT
jgi:DNA-binding NtrC family response regulator